MIPEDDWYDVAEDDSAIEPAMLTMPLYDEDGNEIPEEELPWNNMTDEKIVDEDTKLSNICFREIRLGEKY